MAFSNQKGQQGGGYWQTPASARAYNRSLEAEDRNPVESFRLNQIAAEEGMHDAVLAMGWFYLNGVGTLRDVEAAVTWYRKSARQGDPRAMFSLGQIAYISEDYGEALTWFKRAAALKHHRSLYWIGKIHWRGDGVPQNRKLAIQFFSQAARHKRSEAQRFLRFLHSLKKHSY